MPLSIEYLVFEMLWAGILRIVVADNSSTKRAQELKLQVALKYFQLINWSAPKQVVRYEDCWCLDWAWKETNNRVLFGTVFNTNLEAASTAWSFRKNILLVYRFIYIYSLFEVLSSRCASSQSFLPKRLNMQGKAQQSHTYQARMQARFVNVGSTRTSSKQLSEVEIGGLVERWLQVDQSWSLAKSALERLFLVILTVSITTGKAICLAFNSLLVQPLSHMGKSLSAGKNLRSAATLSLLPRQWAVCQARQH